MIDQQEFEHPAAAFHHMGRIGEHHHVIRHRCIAANFQLRAPLQLDETHAAIASDAQFGMIAIVRDGNAGFMRRLDNRGIVACRNFLAVNRQLFCHGNVLSPVHAPLFGRCTERHPQTNHRQIYQRNGNEIFPAHAHELIHA